MFMSLNLEKFNNYTPGTHKEQSINIQKKYCNDLGGVETQELQILTPRQNK